MYQESLNLFGDHNASLATHAQPGGNGSQQSGVLIASKADSATGAAGLLGQLGLMGLAGSESNTLGSMDSRPIAVEGRPAKRVARSGSARTSLPQGDSKITVSEADARSNRAQSLPSVDHLAAARRLQRRLRKAPVRSPEEIRAGRLICRHLVALLQASDS